MMPIIRHRMATDWNLLTPSMPEMLKICSKTTAPEYRMTGRFKMEYITTITRENMVFVPLP